MPMVKWKKKKKRRHKEQRHRGRCRIRYAKQGSAYGSPFIIIPHGIRNGSGKILNYSFLSGRSIVCVHSPLDGEFNCKQLRDPVIATAVNKAIIREGVKIFNEQEKVRRWNSKTRFTESDWRRDRSFVV